MFLAEGVDSDDFLLVLLGILLADGVAIEQFIINIIRVISFLALFLLFDGLLHHLHHYLLQVV
jgi:hypothetical protein